MTDLDTRQAQVRTIAPSVRLLADALVALGSQEHPDTRLLAALLPRAAAGASKGACAPETVWERIRHELRLAYALRQCGPSYLDETFRKMGIRDENTTGWWLEYLARSDVCLREAEVIALKAAIAEFAW